MVYGYMAFSWIPLMWKKRVYSSWIVMCIILIRSNTLCMYVCVRFVILINISFHSFIQIFDGQLISTLKFWHENCFSIFNNWKNNLLQLFHQCYYIVIRYWWLDVKLIWNKNNNNKISLETLCFNLISIFCLLSLLLAMQNTKFDQHANLDYVFFCLFHWSLLIFYRCYANIQNHHSKHIVNERKVSFLLLLL